MVVVPPRRRRRRALSQPQDSPLVPRLPAPENLGHWTAKSAVDAASMWYVRSQPRVKLLSNHTVQNDGLPMVSCGMCSRWQHIPCHDTADDKAGVPRRNWQQEKFYCSRCKPVAMQRMANGTARSSSATSQPRSQSRTHGAPTQATHYNSYSQPTPGMRYSQQGAYSNGMSYAQQYPDQRAIASSSMYGAPQRPQAGISFSHYQPQQHAFSQGAWSNGYPAGDGLAGGSMNHYGSPYQNGSHGAAHQYQVRHYLNRQNACF